MAIAPNMAEIGNARNKPNMKNAKYFKRKIVSLNILFLYPHVLFGSLRELYAQNEILAIIQPSGNCF